MGLPNYESVEYRVTRDGIITRTRQTLDANADPVWKSERKRVTRLAWQSFERKVQPLQLTRWKSSYAPRDIIYDGSAWKLRWVLGKSHVVSNGSNAGPNSTNPAQTLEVGTRHSDPTGDVILAEAMDELWKHSAWRR